MGEERIVYPNDTTRLLETRIAHLRQWQIDNPRCNPREVALVITKLEEAALWSLRMVKHESPLEGGDSNAER